MSDEAGRVERVLEQFLGKPRPNTLRQLGFLTGIPLVYLAARWEEHPICSVLGKVGLNLYSSPNEALMFIVSFSAGLGLFVYVAAIPGMVVGALIDRRASARLRMGVLRSFQLVAIAVFASAIGLYGHDRVVGNWSSLHATYAVGGLAGLAIFIRPSEGSLRRWWRAVVYAGWIALFATIAWPLYGAGGDYLKGATFILAAVLALTLLEFWLANDRIRGK